MRRRCVAALIALTMLHLNVARADTACDAGHGPGSEVPAAATGATAHHGQHADATRIPATPTDAESCETPVLPQCCQALTSCSLLLDGEAGASHSAPIWSTAAASRSTPDAPLSLVTAPEPPPPRA